MDSSGKEFVMLRRKVVFCGIVLLCVGFVGVLEAAQIGKGSQKAPVLAGQLLSQADYAPGELLVRFAPKAKGLQRSKAEREAILTANGGGTIERSYRIVPGLTLVKLPANVTVENALAALKNADGIVYAEPNYKVSICETPNDTYWEDLWGMHNTGQTGGTADADIDAPEAWDTATDANDIIVAVIDTGVDYTHPDLAANMWVNEGEYNGDPNVDDDENGYMDDIYGYDFCNDDGDPIDDHFHGTHCAGTIGAVGNNAEGVVGVCWNVQIMALKFLGSDGSGYSDDAIGALQYAELMGAHVSNNSWGTGGDSKALKDAIEEAGEAGMLFVAAAGNSNRDTEEYPHYPSGYDLDCIISVMATDANDVKAWFSNWGETSVDLAAPGVDILSTFPTYETDLMADLGYSTYYESISGTSMATPHVAGACALVWAQNLGNPDWDHLTVKQAILNTTDELGLDCVTGGRLNVYGAITYDYVKLYVDCDAPGADDGSSWYNAYNELQDALDAVSSYDGGKIRVAQGTYYPDENDPDDRTKVFLLVDDVAIMGGYAGYGETDPNDRDIDTYETILSGDIDKDSVLDSDNSYHVVTGSSVTSTAVLDGFTITAGYADGSFPHEYGGGMFNWIGSPTVVNCTFENNHADGYGGGIFNYSSSLDVANCTFSNNEAGDDGGGMYNYGSSPTVVDCTFEVNNADDDGAGMYNTSNSDPEVTGCTFNGNMADGDGGGMYNDSSSDPNLSGCLFYENEASGNGGGMYNNGNGTEVLCCTLADNSADYGGGIYNDSSGDLTVTSGILWDDTATTSGAEIYNNSGTISVTYCDVEGGYSGTGNMDSDPCFVDPNTDDYHIDPDDSPCIDVGTNSVVDEGDTDLDGDPRIMRQQVDMGVDEARRVHNVDQDKWYVNIQDAIDDDPDYGDTIVAYEDIYDEQVDFKGESITLTSSDPSDWDVVAATIIDPGKDTWGPYGVEFSDSEDPNVILTGFTITGAYYGVYINGADPVIERCIIENNLFSGITCGAGSPTITNNKIRENTDGIHYYSSSGPSITNNWIYNNTGAIGANTGESSVVRNNTIVGNSIVGILHFGDTAPTITNCIVWNNGDEDSDNLGGTFNDVTYSCIGGGYTGDGNIDEDPLFVDADGGDYHLQYYSACIGAGDPEYEAGVGETDIDGDSRVQAGRVDMGADETPYTHWYVDATDGSDTNNGLSWGTAFATIQKGIDESDDYDLVEVAEGEYVENVDFDGKNIMVRSTDPYNWDDVVAATIIDPNDTSSGYGVELSDGEDDAVLAGFTVSGAYDGVYINGADAVIQWCIIEDNSYGGIVCSFASPTITNNKIRENGAGIHYLSFSTPSITNNWVYNNNGTGIGAWAQDPSILRNNTIVGNAGIGIFCFSGTAPTITNCILWDNNDELYNCSATYSCIKDPNDASGEGNITSNPDFVDGYHLDEDSPCIDVGTNTAVEEGEKDIDGDERIIDGDEGETATVDMGGDEYKP